jgi:ParB-like chromosome segregation protein Spo0J
MGYRIHPAAAAMPDMDLGEYEDLKSNIERHGLLTPIELLNGQVIDGRHRYKAVRDLGLEDAAEFVEVDLGDQTPAEYVWSLNMCRRHLTASQKAAVATEFLPQLEAAAKARQKASGGDRKSSKSQESSGENRLLQNCSNRSERSETAVEEAAKIVDVSPRYVADAKRLKEEDPEAFEQVKQGEISLSEAKRQIAPKKRKPKNGRELNPPAVKKECLDLIGKVIRLTQRLGCYDDVRPHTDVIIKKVKSA